MLSRLQLQNFTVFEEADFRFCPGLNIVVGENGTGKSQLLRLAYALAAVSHALNSAPRQNRDDIQRTIADKLVATLRPESLGRLVSRQQGRNRCEISVEFLTPVGADFSFSFATNSKSEVKLVDPPTSFLDLAPVFIPTKEMLSIFPGFAAAYRNRELMFDETYYDLALALETRPLRGKRPERVADLIGELEEIMNAEVLLEDGRFYLYPRNVGRGRLEMPLVAEGIRKIAMLAYLLINGVLRNRSILFWDEPEINLHPRLMHNLAKTLTLLTREGFQIIVATHSLFLLRELQIQIESAPRGKIPARFFALADDKGALHISAGDKVEDVEPLALLDADLEQSERYLALP